MQFSQISSGLKLQFTSAGTKEQYYLFVWGLYARAHEMDYALMFWDLFSQIPLYRLGSTWHLL